MFNPNDPILTYVDILSNVDLKKFYNVDRVLCASLVEFHRQAGGSVVCKLERDKEISDV